MSRHHTSHCMTAWGKSGRHIIISHYLITFALCLYENRTWSHLTELILCPEYSMNGIDSIDHVYSYLLYGVDVSIT